MEWTAVSKPRPKNPHQVYDYQYDIYGYNYDFDNYPIDKTDQPKRAPKKKTIRSKEEPG